MLVCSPRSDKMRSLESLWFKLGQRADDTPHSGGIALDARIAISDAKVMAQN